MSNTPTALDQRGRMRHFLRESIKNDTKQAIRLFFAPVRALALEFDHSIAQLKSMSARKQSQNKQERQPRHPAKRAN